jgi:FkbM family methyltransferase
MSKSQLKQDLNVLEYYNFKKRGYFVDIGASDGISLSNTYMLEKDYNWNGICVEPILNDFNILISNRKNSICVNKAVYNISDTKMKFAIKNFNMCSGLIETMDNQVIIDNKVYDRSVNYDLKEIIDVYTITLNDLLEQSNAPLYIDYLSLDTEGSELEILKSVDFSRYKFGIIDVEHNFVEPRRSQIRNLLESNGYKFNVENNFDDNYILIQKNNS